MRTRRGSSFFRGEMTRMIDQFQPGDYVLATFMVIGDSLQGVVTEVNKIENKVYVAWNGGPVKQHDPDEVMLSVKHVDVSKSMGDAMGTAVGENPTTTDSKDITIMNNHALPGPKFVKRRASMKTINNPHPDNFMGDHNLHGIKEPISGGSNVMKELAYALHNEASKLSKEGYNGVDIGRTASAGRRVAMYHGQRGRVYRRTRREREEDIVTCPKCRPDVEEMEVHPFTRGVKLWICPVCNWKITSDKIVDGCPNVENELELKPRRS